MIKSVNRLLIFGIILVVSGISLFLYSLTAYIEVNGLYDKINFEEIDNNNQISISDKYYKYLSFSDFLNQKLNKNKNLPIKNISCTYLDYAQHNAMSLYKLVNRGSRIDNVKRQVAESNIQYLLNILPSYASCKQAANYKSEFDKVLEDLNKSNNFGSADFSNMNSFTNDTEQIQKREDYEVQEQNKGEIILQDSYSGESDTNQDVYSPEEEVSSDYEVSGSYQ